MTCQFTTYTFFSGRTYIIWLLLVTFCYSYNSWCIPLRATFPYQTPDNLAIWMTLDYICDVIYLLDVMAVKPKLMFLHEGFWVDDPNETRKNYRRKTQYKVSLVPSFSIGPLRLTIMTFLWSINRLPLLGSIGCLMKSLAERYIQLFGHLVSSSAFYPKF